MTWLEGGYRRHAKFFPIYVDPEPDHPLGRKGYTLARAWQILGKRAKADGMLILDGDVAVDPTHVATMFDHIHSDPNVVWTAPVRIWPVSTHRPDWVWAHWSEKASQELDADPQYFSFCFTYLPGMVIDQAIRGGLSKWVYPRVDAGMSATARKMGVKARMVENCFPVHQHWS